MTRPDFVLVHTCHDRDTDPRRLPQFNLDRKYYTDDPKFSSFLPLPLKCKCKKMVSKNKAKDMLENGQALSVFKPPLARAKDSEEGLRLNDDRLDLTQIVSVVNRAQTPRVDVITKADVERAYISGSAEDIEHIERMHAMLVESLLELIVPWSPDPQEGRLLFPFGPDQRTIGGH